MIVKNLYNFIEEINQYSIKISFQFSSEFHDSTLLINVNFTLISYDNSILTFYKSSYTNSSIFIQNLRPFKNYTLKIYTFVENSSIFYLSREINFTTKPDKPDGFPEILKHGFIRNNQTSVTIFFKVTKK